MTRHIKNAERGKWVKGQQTNKQTRDRDDKLTKIDIRTHFAITRNQSTFMDTLCCKENMSAEISGVQISTLIVISQQIL
jgi:hypothetical protein